MKIKTLVELIETRIPLSLQEEWDHSGLQLGDLSTEIDKVLLTLNVDENTIQQAIDHQCHLIISHHPFLFHSFKTIDISTIHGKNIEKLIKNDICVYSMHTNYDKLRMNKFILEKLGCIDIYQDGYVAYGKYSYPTSINDLVNHLKQTFDLKVVRACGKTPDHISNISICAGSGHDFIDEALNASDVYITGDLSYSHAMDIILKDRGLVLEVTHFIESVFKEDMFNLLDKTTDLSVLSSIEKDYFGIY